MTVSQGRWFRHMKSIGVGLRTQYAVLRQDVSHIECDRLLGVLNYQSGNVCQTPTPGTEHENPGWRLSISCLDHTVLLWAMRRNELLAQAIAAHQRRVAAACKNEPIVRPKQEWRGYPAQRAKSSDQGMPQRATGRRRLAAARQVPAQQFARVATRKKKRDCLLPRVG